MSILNCISTCLIVWVIAVSPCHRPVQGQPIVFSGDYSPTYNGSNPWAVNDNLELGNGNTLYSHGEMLIEGAATVTNDAGRLGIANTTSGKATIRGNGAHWNNLEHLSIGTYGGGEVRVENGGKVTSTRGFVGFQSRGNGLVIVDGVGSLWENTANDILIGDDGGYGTLLIDNGGKVTSWGGRAGENLSGTQFETVGNVRVRGMGSHWDSTGFEYSRVSIGVAAKAFMTIEDGGRVSNSRGFVGTLGGGNGTVTVRGNSSIWENDGFLEVGKSGTAKLDIVEGGLVESTSAYLGVFSGSSATVKVNDVGSIWNISNDLVVGGNRLTGATPTSSSTNVGGRGNLVVDDGGHVIVGQTLKLWDNGSIIIWDGTLEVESLDLTADTNSGFTFNVLTNGELVVGSILGDYLVASGTFSAKTVQGNLVQNGGTIAPGNSPGATQINGDYTLNGGVLHLEIAETTPEIGYDVVNVTGSAMLDGLIDVDLLDGFLPSEGDTFVLVNASEYSVGTDLSFDLSDAQLPTDLYWDTEDFGATGSLTVTSDPPTGALLLGDLNLDGAVDFLDISPFISVLSDGEFQAEADCDQSGAVDFLDISPFIGILSGA